MKKKTVTISMGEDQERPIAMLVQVASQFSSEVHIESGTKFVNAKSIMGMMTLNIVNGEELTVVADGSDESEAIESMENYLTNAKS